MLYLWSRERGGALPDINSEQTTYLDAKLPSQRPNVSALFQREVQPTMAALRLGAYGPPVLVVPTMQAAVSWAASVHCFLLLRAAPSAQWCWLWLSLFLAVCSVLNCTPWPTGQLVFFCPCTCSIKAPGKSVSPCAEQAGFTSPA